MIVSARHLYPQALALVVLALACAVLAVTPARSAPQMGTGGGLLVRYAPEGAGGVGMDGFYAALLDLALSRTIADSGPYAVEPALSLSAANVFWAARTAQRDAAMRAVTIDLVRGYKGLRLLVVRSGDRSRFSALEPEAIKSYPGLVLGSRERLLFQSNGVALASLAKGRHPLAGLSAGEAAWFALDPFDLRRARAKGVLDGFGPAEGVAFQINEPVYFYVPKDRADLAERLAAGLILTFKDGSYEALFSGHPDTRDLAETLGLKDRRVLQLSDPTAIN